MIELLDEGERPLQRGPSGPLAVVVTGVRVAGVAGREYRLADAVKKTLALRVVGRRATLFRSRRPGPPAYVDLDVDELGDVAALGQAWLDRRVELAAYDGGLPPRWGGTPLAHYAAGRWEPITIARADPAFESTCAAARQRRTVPAARGDKLGPGRIIRWIEAGTGERTGAIVRFGADHCAIATRATLRIERAWPHEAADAPGRPDPLPGVELYATSIAVLVEAAADRSGR